MTAAPATDNGSCCTQMSECDDVAIEKVVIKNYGSLLPKDYKRLYVKYASMAVPCTICKENVEENQLLIGTGSMVFHVLCLLYEHKFEGKVNEINGFAEISSDDKEILRTNVPTPESDIEADEEDDDYLYEDDDDCAAETSDVEIEPPSKKSSSAVKIDLMPKPKIIIAKDRTKEQKIYDEFLNTINPEQSINNPERSWGQKEDVSTKPAMIKRGTVVDKEFADGANCFVVKTEREDLFSVTLCLTDCLQNKNCYFKMQLLQDDNQPVFHLFRSWGRIGTRRGGNLAEIFNDQREAILEFERDFEQLTRNKWRERHYFNPKPGYMSLVEMDYTEFETLICGPDGKLIPAGTKSTLNPQIKNILLKIFDAKNIKKALDGYNFDMERMPMGKLSAMQVSRASGLLKSACELVELAASASSLDRSQYEKQIAEISDKFYSTLPQSFGHCSPALLSKQGQIDKMRGMIDALLDIIFVCNIMNETQKESRASGIDPIDLQYSKLMMKMEVVPPDHDDFKMVKSYIDNGIGATHGFKGFQLLDLIRLERYGEGAKFRRHYGNRKLLWHGSPVQNFPGILTQGLRIAPADALLTGHAFGRGVYFADMISKSANYCRVLPTVTPQVRGATSTASSKTQQPPQSAAQREAADTDQIGYLLLCDVALGSMKELNYGASAGISPTDPQFNSVKGVGETYPDPVGDFVHPDGYSVPLGRCIRGNVNRTGGFLYYNEFIVYDTDQICSRYLVRVKFDHYR